MTKPWLIVALVAGFVGIGLTVGPWGYYLVTGYAATSSLGVLLMTLLMLLLGVCVVAAPVGIARWVLRPLDEAARRSRMRLQFTVLDFLCLFVLVQVPMALIHGISRYTPTIVIALADAFSWLCVGSMWFAGVWAMSRAGIHRAADRCLFLVVVLPVSIISVLEFPGWVLVVHLMTAFSRPLQEMLPSIVVLTVALAGVYPAGAFMRRMVARTESPLPEDDASAAQPAADDA